MKKFILKTILFIICPLLVAIILDIPISNQLKNVKDFPCENEVWNDIYNSSIKAEIAILGSSRAWVHFDPKIISDSLNTQCYNFGEDASNILLQYIRYKEYTTFNLKPKLVIISIDMWTFINRNNGYPTNRYYPYMLWNTRVFNILKGYNKEGYNKNKFFIPMLRYLGLNQIKLIINNPSKPYFKGFNKSFELSNNGKFRFNGYRGMDLHWKENDNSAQIKDYEVDIDTSLVTIMKSFIKEIQQEGINIIMVYTPEYKDGQSIVKNRNEVFSKFEEISSIYNVPIYDYSDSLISEKKELFYNVQHLNKEGATIFTNQFINDFKARTHNVLLK
jgi:hypothetical protein